MWDECHNSPPLKGATSSLRSRPQTIGPLGEYYVGDRSWRMRRETTNNSGLGWGDGAVESMGGRGTSQGGYGATALMDRRDAWKQVCL
ncbi:unnamed protein product [Cochlearia groenlandica]